MDLTIGLKNIYISFCFFLLLFSACTQIDFTDFSNNENPVVTCDNTKVTITVGDSYVPAFTVSDDKDSQEYLLNNIRIWVEDEWGTELNFETFTDIAGTYFVYIIATDSDGNTSDATVIEVVVSEKDVTPPVMTILGPVPYIINIGDVFNDPGARAVDNFDGDVSDRILTSGSVDAAHEGDYTIHYSVSDNAGNEATAERIVTVKDSQGDDMTKPEIQLLGDNPYTLYLGETYVDPGATATDNKDGDITDRIEKYDTVINTSVADTHTVHYRVSDVAGNIALASRMVSVEVYIDTIPPVITLLGDNPLLLNLGDAYTEPGATAEDNVDGDLTGAIDIDNDEVNTNQNGIYTVYYSVSDEAGNKGEAERVVVVGIIDSVPPVITLNGPNPMAIDYMGVYKEPGAYAMDSVGDVVDSIPFSQFTVKKDINVTVLGTYKVTYTVSDEAGNETSAEREVEVADTIAPVIIINGPNTINLGLGYPYTEYGASAMDNYDGDLTSQLDTVGDVNIMVGGTYTITYTVTDQHGNVGIAERKINVAFDTSPPIITLLGSNPMNVDLGGTFIDPGATAYDSTDGDITNNIVVTGTVNTSIADTYILTYSVSDTAGNSAEKTRNVIVSEDNTPPVITLNGSNPMNLSLGQNYNEPGATAYDDIDGDLTDSIEISGNVNTSSAGTYIITYTVSDKSGNEANKTRTVNVSGNIILTSGDNGTTIFSVNSETTFQINTSSTIRLYIYIIQGYGSFSFNGGQFSSYQVNNYYIDISPISGKITCVVRPTSSTRVRFSW